MTQSTITVSVLALPEADTSALTGMFTILNLFDKVVPGDVKFAAKIVSAEGMLESGGGVPAQAMVMPGLPVTVHGVIEQLEHTDLVLIPSLYTDHDGHWQPGRYPVVVDWLRRMYGQGTVICSACTGALLLAETGLLDGEEATQHWAFERTFRHNFPKVRLDTRKLLVVSGEDDRLVMSGASAAWHDLVLYLAARFAGAPAARMIARFFLLQWHTEGQAPYMVFQENTWHGDGAVLAAQDWLREHLTETAPVEHMARVSGLSERSFIRRFKKATEMSPISYIQHMRIERAKQLLEGGAVTVDAVCLEVGYEDPSFFRRLFKRLTDMTPGAYRKKFSGIGTVGQ